MDNKMKDESQDAPNSLPARTRRTKNWWEPMFCGEQCGDFKLSDWDFDNNKGPRNFLLTAEKLADAKLIRVSDVSFEDCDFQGDFKTQIVFKGCTFKKCDFGLSTFRRAKFSHCTFRRTSFSQAIMDNCEFRNCNYNQISFSGNETQIPRTLITEPNKFIFGGQASTENLPQHMSALIQKLRFEETRSTLSRSVLANLDSEGSEDSFYEAVRTASICEDRARLAGGLLKALEGISLVRSLRFLVGSWRILTGAVQILSSILSLIFLNAMGLLNGWGGNVTRVLIIGVTIPGAVAYWRTSTTDIPFVKSLENVAEVFLLFGYTKHATASSGNSTLWFCTALLGVFWYALAIPTFVNRLTRLRG